MQSNYFELYPSYSSSNERKEAPPSEIAITIHNESHLELLPNDNLKDILKFLSLNERAKLSLSAKRFYELYKLNPDFLAIRTLTKMIKDIDQPFINIALTKKVVLTKLVLLLALALCTLGTVEFGLEASQGKSSSIFPTISLGFMSLCMLSGILGCWDTIVLRPSETEGRLKKLIQQYNEIFPNDILGADGDDGKRDSDDLRALFEAGREAVRYCVDNNLGAYRANIRFFPVREKLTAPEMTRLEEIPMVP